MEEKEELLGEAGDTKEKEESAPNDAEDNLESVVTTVCQTCPYNITINTIELP